MKMVVDDGAMTIVMIIFGFVLVSALAALFGADSRPIERGYPRRNWF